MNSLNKQIEILYDKKRILDDEIKQLGFKNNIDNVKIIVNQIHSIMEEIKLINKSYG